MKNYFPKNTVILSEVEGSRRVIEKISQQFPSVFARDNTALIERGIVALLPRRFLLRPRFS